MLLLEKVMWEKHLNQSALARLAEVHPTSLSRIINGKEPAFPKRGERIAKALGWEGDPAELFEEVEAVGE